MSPAGPSPSGPPTSPRGPARRPLGLRREVLFFLPTALFLLVVIASFNLLAYRNALRDLEAERIAAATALVAHAATALSEGPQPSVEGVRQLVPDLVAATIHNEDGRRGGSLGTPAEIDLPGLVGAAEPERAVAFGPSTLDVPRVVALAPFHQSGLDYVLQVDLDAAALAGRLADVRRLLVVNVVVLGALSLLVLLFLRHLLAPWEALLESARRVETPSAANVDESRFLVETFEKALEALERRQPAEADDIDMLQRTLAPSLESGFMLLDPTGEVLAVNELGAELLGVDEQAAAGGLADLLPHARDLADTIEDAVLHGRAVRRREIEIGHDDTGQEGERRILGVTMHPMRRDDGSARAFILLFSDLTRSKHEARRAEISRSLNQLGEIAAGVAHEMRNGLATLKGYLTLLDRERDPASAQGFLAEMRSESDHLERVLSDFLAFARPGSLRGEVLDLARVVERAIADPTLDPLEVQLSPLPAPVRLTGDGQLLERALRNLLHNAHQAQADSGSTEPLGVRLTSSGGQATIEIEDSGSGLPSELADALFQPFVSGRPDGVGLGLALAHRIVELHGGELTLENRRARGARATIRLPVRVDT